MSRPLPLADAAVHTLHRVFPFLSNRPAPRFKFGAQQQLLLSLDAGRSWRGVIACAPGYKNLRLWRQGAVTYLQLEYADRTEAYLSTDGAHWRPGGPA